MVVPNDAPFLAGQFYFHSMGLYADGVTKRFGPYTAVKNVSLVVESGDSVAIHGPNGSGKTTLVRMLAGLSAPNEGTVSLNGHDLYSEDHTPEEPIGYLSHESMSYDDLTARENLIFHARLRDIPEQRVEAVLETVELSDRASGFPREFSHGMRKRLSLARALLSDPNVLLLDEPFTGLDQHSTQTLERIISDRTVVLVTHDPDMSVALCNRFVLLNDGQLVDQIDDPELTPSAFRRAYEEVRA